MSQKNHKGQKEKKQKKQKKRFHLSTISCLYNFRVKCDPDRFSEI